ncbi:HAD-IA family hydrolase [candidate division KSB1 bacterium]|nr:HAD-IA family hydrolase [candidate division KSB1 bacterium]
MQYESANYIEKKLDFWNLFESPIFSCRINMVKPEMSIFQHLLDYHQLEASETVFIDDMQVNVESAQELGIHPIRFENAQQCRQQLKDLGCL